MVVVIVVVKTIMGMCTKKKVISRMNNNVNSSIIKKTTTTTTNTRYISWSQAYFAKHHPMYQHKINSFYYILSVNHNSNPETYYLIYTSKGSIFLSEISKKICSCWLFWRPRGRIGSQWLVLVEGIIMSTTIECPNNKFAKV